MLQEPFLGKKLTQADWWLIGANLVPVLGVWFSGWSATEVFIVYALETLMVGVLTAIKLSISSIARGSDEWQANGEKKRMGGIAFILFFLVHYGMFAMVQTAIFSQTSGIAPNGSGPLYFFTKWYTFVNRDVAWMLAVFALSYFFRNLLPFIWKKEYRSRSMMLIMFEPYGRIFIQQFTVILGSIFLSFGAGKIFILVFALAKTAFEVLVDYDRILKMSSDKFTGVSGKQ